MNIPVNLNEAISKFEIGYADSRPHRAYANSISWSKDIDNYSHRWQSMVKNTDHL